MPKCLNPIQKYLDTDLKSMFHRHSYFILVPPDLSYDPITKAFMDPRKRPELTCASFEFVAPSEYMVTFFRAP